MKTFPTNLTFTSLNDLLNGLKDLLPLEIQMKLIELFESNFESYKASQPDTWGPEIYENQNDIIEKLLIQVLMDKEIELQFPFTFRNQFFITFSDSINENSKKKMKHVLHFDTFIASTRVKI